MDGKVIARAGEVSCAIGCVEVEAQDWKYLCRLHICTLLQVIVFLA